MARSARLLLGFPLGLALGIALAQPGCDGFARAPSDADGARRGSALEAALQTPARVGPELDASRRTAIVRASERVAPAVVSINTLRVEQRRTFFDVYDRQVPGLGSGFIIHADGLVLTNEHVVRGATDMVVTLPDGRSFAATSVGADETNDLALLRIDPRAPLEAEGQPAAHEPLPVAPLGTSADLLIGEWVVAIGNPFGFLLSNTEPTVTAGVVSGVHRNMVSGNERSGGLYLDMIQTDAAINPGNSGGALVNVLGEVVGVNASILSTSGGNEGLGFAIPIDRARRIAAELLAHGQVRRAWVGIEVEPAAASPLLRVGQVRIAGVAPGSPAAAAGLQPGWVVASAQGRTVRSPLDWQAALLNAGVGDPIALVVDDGRRRREVRLTPVEVPSLAAERVQALRDFELVTLTPAIRAERGVASEQGALIVRLSETARGLGLREGDVIVMINRARVRDAEEAAALLEGAGRRGYATLTFERFGQYGQTSFRIR
ncbi:MAG TPA: trypsin-like peptidase domain-containing protein [Longimicrobiales bacterium]|nr:trypsin-like peptidase domain-containing protein [Longimicrobiales bacterium]